MNIHGQNQLLEYAIRLIEKGLPSGSTTTHLFTPGTTRPAFEPIATDQYGVIKTMNGFSQ